MTAHLYLSPHLDDAVLSCGGAIAAQTRRGERVIVVTVCTAIPQPPYSRFAEELHAQMGLSAADAVRARLAEDDRALAVLGAETIRLDRLDAIYRRPDAYDSLATLFGTPAAGDALELPELPAGQLYAPLAIGDHVDHQLVRRAAPPGCLFYEDVPYVLTRPRTGEPARIAEQDLASHLDAVACYASQLGFLFGEGGEAAMRAALTAQFAHGTRFWR